MQRPGYSSAFGSQRSQQSQSASRGSGSQQSQSASSGSGTQQSQSASSGSGSQQTGGSTQAPALPPQLQVPPTPGYRHVFLVSSCYRQSRSHWFIWIPTLQRPTIGRMIHVTGSTLQGFGVEFRDNHDMLQSKHDNRFVYLGLAPATSLKDGYVPHDGNVIYRAEGELRDDFDIAAWSIELPRRDNFRQEPQNDPVWISPHPRFERCQEWTRRFIAELVEDNRLPSSALQAMDTAVSYMDVNGRRFAYSHFAPPWGT